jgi:hypothetical protein
VAGKGFAYILEFFASSGDGGKANSNTAKKQSSLPIIFQWTIASIECTIQV